MTEWTQKHIEGARKAARDAHLGGSPFQATPVTVLSLLDALEDARRDAEEARTLAETLREDLRRMGRASTSSAIMR